MNKKLLSLFTIFLFTSIGSSEEFDFPLKNKMYSLGANIDLALLRTRQSGKAYEERSLQLDVRYGYLVFNKHLEVGPIVSYNRFDSDIQYRSRTFLGVGAYADFHFAITPTFTVGPSLGALYRIRKFGRESYGGYSIHPAIFANFFILENTLAAVIRVYSEYREDRGWAGTPDSTTRTIGFQTGTKFYF